MFWRRGMPNVAARTAQPARSYIPAGYDLAKKVRKMPWATCLDIISHLLVLTVPPFLLQPTTFYECSQVMPKVSPTEKAALNAGTVGFDGELFEGAPSLKNLVKKYDIALSPDEQSFMNKQVTEACAMMDDYQVMRDRDLPEHVWEYLKREKFFGMIIPKKYGGLGFTAHGHSQVVTKIASRSGSAAVTVMVPNSLGPGELLMRYGTEEQKDWFLPRLASGDIIPCFGLTGPASGSDAASMRDLGIVEEQNGVLGVRTTFKKRYITLAPIAGVVGLAFNLKDPKGLLKGTGNEGITIALLKRGHSGMRIGPRHDPLNSSFMNGTVEGEDVFIPMADLLGGQARAGFGWNMLMDCLAEGRSISLPALSVAAAKGVVTTVGAYARIRKQFKVPLAEMEGVQESLARIAGNAYIMQSAQLLTNAMLNKHEQPAVISAIMKQQMTSRMRVVVNDGMDILGGAGICNGPANFLANAYTSIPIAITVEGANTLTRSLIQFGQGLTRAHPHLLHIIEAIGKGNDMKGFNAALTGIIGHGATNLGRSLLSSALRSRSRGKNPVPHYESQLQKLSANFALCSDLALTMGGKLKAAEFISGRFADVLSNIYLGYAVLWHYQKYPVEGSEALVDYSMQNILCDAEDALHGIYSNFPVPGVGLAMRAFTSPTGRCYTRPSDDLTRRVSSIITTDSKVREQFAANLFVPSDLSDRTALINAALSKCVKADVILAKLKKEKRQPSTQEKADIDEAETMREQIIQVDAFARLGSEIQQGQDWTPSQRPGVAVKAGVMAAAIKR